MEVSYQGEAHYPENIGDVVTTVGGHGIGGGIGGNLVNSIGGHGGILGRL